MKHLFFILIIGIVLTSCNNSEKAPADIPSGFVDGSDTIGIISLTDTNKRTQILWIDTLKDLGTLPKKGQVEVSFRFKNVGTKPLSIISVVAGCGCTSPQKPRDPIAPGEESYVRAKFNTESQNGQVQKSISVVSNTEPNTKSLFFKANVVEEKK